MSSALDRKGDVHDFNIFNFQGHVAQIIKEKLSWVCAAVAEYANKQLDLETISAWLIGVNLTSSWDFLSYWKESRTKQNANPSLFYMDDTKSFLTYAVSSGSTSPRGVVWTAVSRARKTLPAKPHQILSWLQWGTNSSMTGHKGHSLLSVTRACRSPSLMFNAIFSCPHQPLLLPSTIPESAVFTSPDSAR